MNESQRMVEELDASQRYNLLVAKKLEEEQIRNVQLQNIQNQMSGFSASKDSNIAELQLELEKDLDKIFHLLSGHQLVIIPNQGEYWVEPEDDRLKIFSDYGVKQIMNLISFYVNKNKLLSFYDESTIKWKVRDFGIELSDLIFNKYEKFFYYPTPEELFNKYKPIVSKKELNISDDELYFKCVEWSREELYERCVHYSSMVLAIIDAVDDTYRRALGGKERESFRKYFQFSQNIASNPSPQLSPPKPSFMRKLIGSV